MKTRISAIMFLIACSFACGQSQSIQPSKPLIVGPIPTDNRPLSPEEWKLKVVTHLITPLGGAGNRFPDASSGQALSLPSPAKGVEFLLYPMGDEAAVDVIKALGPGGAATPAQMQSALEIIHTAFEHPEAIHNPVDREPRAAMLLLQSFASTSNDQGLKERISGEVGSLRAVAARSAASADPQAK